MKKIFIIILLCLFAQDTFGQKALKKVNKAPSFEYTLLKGGETGNLDTFKDKIIVLDFWFMKCKPCVEMIPTMEKLYQEFKDKDVVFLGVNSTDKDTKALEEFLMANNVTYPTLLVEKESVDKTKYGVMGYPTVFIIDKSQKITYEKVGATIYTSKEGNKTSPEYKIIRKKLLKLLKK